ncbi:F-box only protein 36 isoform X8 [Canis lupus familiaris]|uniref:F-box only protein 36 isoform X8 n=1 Tax=Canis lupus familiaris TaxID=9615 RepID=UPI0018F40C47|nr:F-box only protein 36 isoform X8 [Canis lupus familiaris]
MTPAKPRPFLVVLATPVASQDGVVAAGDAVRNCRTRPSAEQRLLPVTGHPVPEFPPREEEEQASPACVQRCSLTSAWEAEKERLSQVSRGGAGRGGERERDDLSSRGTSPTEGLNVSTDVKLFHAFCPMATSHSQEVSPQKCCSF